MRLRFEHGVELISDGACAASHMSLGCRECSSPDCDALTDSPSSPIDGRERRMNREKSGVIVFIIISNASASQLLSCEYSRCCLCTPASTTMDVHGCHFPIDRWASGGGHIVPMILSIQMGTIFRPFGLLVSWHNRSDHGLLLVTMTVSIVVCKIAALSTGQSYALAEDHAIGRRRVTRT